MIEFLRDSLWGSIGAMIAVIGLVGSTIWAVIYRPRKTLSYEIISSSTLVATIPAHHNVLKVLFNDSEVEEPAITIFRVRNSGNVPILANDFERPMAYGFPGAKRLLSAEIQSSQPASLQPYLELPDIVIEFPAVTVNKLLLNPGDSFDVLVVLDGLPENVTAYGRIAGVKDIRLARSASQSRPTLTTAWLMLISLIGFGWIEIFGDPWSGTPLSLIVNLACMAIALVVFARVLLLER